MAATSDTQTTSPAGQHGTPAQHAPRDGSRGNAGELHQHAGLRHPPLTTNQGVRIADDQNSLRATPRGPALLEDFVLREKITRFDHERIPERVVHARASAAHGWFELTESLAQYTTAKILTEAGVKTPVFTRISTVASGAGSIDDPHDVRGGDTLRESPNGFRSFAEPADDIGGFVNAAKTRQWERERKLRQLA